MKIIISENQLRGIINEQTDIKGCQQLFSNDVFTQAKKYWEDWLKNPVTIGKIAKNNGISVDVVMNEYIPKWVGILDRVTMTYDSKGQNDYATSTRGDYKIHVNCDVYMRYGNKVDQSPLNILVHEIQHQLSFILPLNPDSMITGLTRNSQMKSISIFNRGDIINNAVGSIKRTFNLSGGDDELKHYVMYYLGIGNRGDAFSNKYVFNTSEISSRVQSIREKYGIKPGESIDPMIFKDVFFGRVKNSDMQYMIVLWARDGFPDFVKFLAGLDSLAMGKNNIKYDMV